MKNDILSDITVVKVVIHSFKRDINGNTTAHHRVETWEAGTTVPSAILYETPRRTQVGYNGYDDWTDTALFKASIKDSSVLTLLCRTGSRQDDKIEISYATGN